MINFEKYVGDYIVLVTNGALNYDEISGIRIQDSRVFKFKRRFIAVRKLTHEDLKDDDFLDWLRSMWGTKETKLKNFIRLRVSYDQKRASCKSEKS